MSEVEEKVVESTERPKAVTQRLEPDTETPTPRPRQAETTRLELEPETAGKAAAPAPRLGLTRQELNWAALAHASILITMLLGVGTGGLGVVLGLAIPAIIWYAYRDKSAYVVDQARQATVFQVAGVLGLMALAIVGAILLTVGWTVTGLLTIVLVGLLLIPFALILTVLFVVAVVGLPIAQVVYGCYAAVEAYNGRPFRYRWIADLIDRYQTQA